jgi:hypothetical protein
MNATSPKPAMPFLEVMAPATLPEVSSPFLTDFFLFLMENE